MEDNKNNQKVSASDVQKNMINAFEWVQGIYDESIKLLKDTVKYFQDDKRILMVKNPPIEELGGGCPYTYMLASYLAVGSDKIKTDKIGVIGVSLVDKNNRPFPRIVLGSIKLKESMNIETWQKKKKSGWRAQYLLLDCIHSEKFDEENVFIKPTKIKGTVCGNKVVSESFTHVPLASINNLETLYYLLDEATLFFQEGEEPEKLISIITELRDKAI